MAVEFAFLLAQESEPPVLVDLSLSWILAIDREDPTPGGAPTRAGVGRNGLETERRMQRSKYKAQDPI